MDWIIENNRPIWLQLYEQLILRIVTGVYPMGGRIPPVRELAAEAGVNPNTMQRALSHLEEQGLAVTNRTAGRLVTRQQELVEQLRLQLAQRQMMRYLQGMEELGYQPEAAKAMLMEQEGTLWKKD